MHRKEYEAGEVIANCIVLVCLFFLILNISSIIYRNSFQYDEPNAHYNDIVKTDFVTYYCENDECHFQYRSEDGAWYGTDIGEKLVIYNNLVRVDGDKDFGIYTTQQNYDKIMKDKP